MDSLALPRVYARNCLVRKLTKDEARAFFDACHRLGFCACRHFYGLFISRRTGASEAALPQGSLVAAAGFSSARNMSDKGGTARSFEWVRYASLASCRVVGGMGKLLREFAREHKPGDIMTYVDAAENGGDSFAALGFALEGRVRDKSGEHENLKFRKIF